MIKPRKDPRALRFLPRIHYNYLTGVWMLQFFGDQGTTIYNMNTWEECRDQFILEEKHWRETHAR